MSNERLEVLKQRGRGECLEAIFAIGDLGEQRVALTAYMFKHRNRDTKHTRRAQRKLTQLSSKKA